MEAQEEKEVDFDYVISDSDVLVLGSGHSRVSKAYNKILTEKLSVEHYFMTMIQGLIESLAYNLEGDRLKYINLLRKNLKKNIDRVIIFADIGYTDENCEKYLAKKERRKVTAIKAKERILSDLKLPHPNINIMCYLIVVDKKTGKVISCEPILTEDQTQSNAA